MLWIHGLGLVAPVDNHVYNLCSTYLSVCVIAVRPMCVPGALPIMFPVVIYDSICAGMVCAMVVVFTESVLSEGGRPHRLLTTQAESDILGVRSATA